MRNSCDQLQITASALIQSKRQKQYILKLLAEKQSKDIWMMSTLNLKLCFDLMVIYLNQILCAPSPLVLCVRHPTQASLKVTPRCCGSVASCRTPCTITAGSASTRTGPTRPSSSTATWRSWAPWSTRLTSGRKKMFRRSGRRAFYLLKYFCDSKNCMPCTKIVSFGWHNLWSYFLGLSPNVLETLTLVLILHLRCCLTLFSSKK